MLFLSLQDEPAPYVVPACFGREEGMLYVHSARTGTKIDLLRAHPAVGFPASTEMTVLPGGSACDGSSRARSVAGTATARIVEDDAERVHGLAAVMRHYAAPGSVADASYRAGPLSRTRVIALRIDTLRARRTG